MQRLWGLLRPAEDPKVEQEGSRNAPVEEGRGAVNPEKNGPQPWGRAGFQQGKNLPGEWAGRGIPQALPAQKKCQPFTVGVEDQKHTVEQLVRNPCLPGCFGTDSSGCKHRPIRARNAGRE